MVVDTHRFTGFRPEAIDFLADLAQNNERAWFQARKAEYERLLKDPMEDFVVALADAFAARKLPFQADPKRSIFRIYRDTRFAKDKSPYKTHIGASFPWLEGSDLDAAMSHTEHGNGADRQLRLWQLVSRERPEINPLKFSRTSHDSSIVKMVFC